MSTPETKKREGLPQQQDSPERHNANNKDLLLVPRPRQLVDSPADVLTPDANHLEDRRPEFTDHDEQPGESDRCNCKSDDRRQGFAAEAPLNATRDKQHSEHEEHRHRNIDREVEALFRNTVTGARHVTDAHRVCARNSINQSLFALRLLIWHMKAVSIDKLLDKFCVNDQVTTIRVVGEI